MVDWFRSLDQAGLVSALVSGVFTVIATVIGEIVARRRTESTGSGRSGGQDGRQRGQDAAQPRATGPARWWRRYPPKARVAIAGGLTVVVVGLLLAFLLPGGEDSPDRRTLASPGPTATPTATSAATTAAGRGTAGNPYPPGHRTVLLDQAMVAENGGWRNLNSGTGTCRFGPDGYHVASTGGNKYHECYGTKSVRDFTYEVEFSFGTARAAGIFFRQSGEGSWYFAEVGRSGTVWLSKGVAGSPADPDLFTGQAPAPDPARRHRLAVTAVGDRFAVYVDGERVGEMTDGQFAEGGIGVFTDGGKAPDGTDPDGETVFHHVRLWQP
ncbi:family 16 glycoside hydrolase [Micromonospora sp. NPDC049559]|uniref:family 16 glycoside hydrolase n=1 Tax=Micromonospora sp. NPDC049559 TaxID=3155923 RepID=UPI003422B024